jgi:hypothetical protein
MRGKPRTGDVAVHQARQRAVDQPGRLRQRQVTRGGGYCSPSQADNGTVITRTDRFAGVQRFGMMRD